MLMVRVDHFRAIPLAAAAVTHEMHDHCVRFFLDFDCNIRCASRNLHATRARHPWIVLVKHQPAWRNPTMSRCKPTLALAFALIFAGALQGCATYGKCGLEGCAGDAKVTANVQALIDEHPELGSPNSVDVQTLDHVVYLNGEVSTGMDSRTAESIALAAPDVTRVVNLIAVSH
jgi:hypothetical protein